MELEQISGIGKARKQSFEENDIFSCEDLLEYFPYKYYNFSNLTNTSNLESVIYRSLKLILIYYYFNFVPLK